MLPGDKKNHISILRLMTLVGADKPELAKRQ